MNELNCANGVCFAFEPFVATYSAVENLSFACWRYSTFCKMGQESVAERIQCFFGLGISQQCCQFEEYGGARWLAGEDHAKYGCCCWAVYLVVVCVR